MVPVHRGENPNEQLHVGLQLRGNLRRAVLLVWWRVALALVTIIQFTAADICNVCDMWPPFCLRGGGGGVGVFLSQCYWCCTIANTATVVRAFEGGQYLHYTTVLHTTLLYSTLHYTTLLYSTLHYTIVLHTTLLNSTLHYATYYTTQHYTTLLYSTLHYTTVLHTTLHYTTEHHTALRYLLHYSTLHYATLLYSTLHYTTVLHTTLHY